jgi:hypothetical protein
VRDDDVISSGGQNGAKHFAKELAIIHQQDGELARMAALERLGRASSM